MNDRNLLIQKRLDRIKRHSDHGKEYWMARDIQPILGYSEWQKFKGVVKKACMACESSGCDTSNHIIQAANMVVVGSGARRERVDYFLSRYACYLVAMNGDSSKPEIGFAQTYFAIQARRMETLEALSEEERRLELRQRVRGANKDLNIAAKQAGVQNYALFYDAGYRGLYNMSQRAIKRTKDIPKNETLLDRAGRVELAANEFRITQCEEKLVREEIQGQQNAINTHHEVGRMVRDTIQRIGGTMPENLNPVPHIKQIEKKKELYT